MMPVTRDLWIDLIQDAERNPREGCARRALHLALVMKSMEDHVSLLIIQFSPTLERLLFAPRTECVWATHYATVKDGVVYDPALKVPLRLHDYIPRAFPGQELTTHYYHPRPEIPLIPKNAISSQELSALGFSQ